MFCSGRVDGLRRYVMERKIYNIEIIGIGLALLYAVSFMAFINYLNIPEIKTRTIVYVAMFGTLCIGSIGVVTRKEWGRKVLVVLNFIMLICIAVRFIPKVDLAPLAYLFLSIIVLLYFTQSNIKLQFQKGKQQHWSRSILVIDDDDAISKIVRPILFSHGYSVLAASTGEEGLQIARTQKPDLILLDVILPGLKGRDVCVKLKEDPQTKEIPVVFLTSKDSPEDVQAENKVGSSGHLTKPVAPKTLVDMVVSVLDSKTDKKK